MATAKPPVRPVRAMSHCQIRAARQPQHPSSTFPRQPVPRFFLRDVVESPRRDRHGAAAAKIFRRNQLMHHPPQNPRPAVYCPLRSGDEPVGAQHRRARSDMCEQGFRPGRKNSQRDRTRHVSTSMREGSQRNPTQVNRVCFDFQRSTVNFPHDSPGANTRVIPSSILSKRDTSCSRCFVPAGVSL